MTGVQTCALPIGTVASARDALSQVNETCGGLGEGLSSSLDALAGTRTKANTLAAQLNGALLTGAATIDSVSSTASYDVGRIAGDVGWAQGRIDAAIAQVRALDGATTNVRTGLERVRTYTVTAAGNEYATQLTTKVDASLALTAELSDSQRRALDRLQQISDGLKDATDGVSGLSNSVGSAVSETTGALADLQNDLAATTMPQLNEALDGFSNTGGTLAGTALSLPAMLAQADSALRELDGILNQCSIALSTTADSVRGASDRIMSISADVAAVESAESFDGIKDALDLDAESVGDFLGSPAQLVSMPVYPVENYGSGVTPFYTNLALWVGGFVLVAIYKLEVDREGVGDFKPWQGFFGRWLLLNLLGQAQAAICCLGDIALGIQCASPVAFVFAGMVESFVYVFLIYALSVAFKHIGKALGVLIVVLQIPGASGLYPIQMQPGFFQALNPWLPFTYGINAMREAIAGFYANYYARNLLVLLAYLIPALLVGVTARRHLLNINNLFDRKLGETDMMIAERTGMRDQFRLATIVKAIMDSDSYRATFLAGAANFELRYPVLVRRGFAALVVVPLVLLALMFATEAKFAMLVLWVLSLVAICAFLIVCEYLHERVLDKTNLSNMSRDELFELLDDELKAEFLAFAPIERMRLAVGQGASKPAAGATARAAEKTTTVRGQDQRGGDE
nr:YhgE/Pip domain-containing protein [Olsenella massiliensis]